MEKELKESWNIINTTKVNCCTTEKEKENANKILYELKMEYKTMNALEILKDLAELQRINILGVAGENGQSFIDKDQFMNAIKIIEKYYKGKIEGLQ